MKDIDQYMSFETERLIVRPTSLEDASFLLELMNTPKWIQFIGDRKVHTEEDAKRYIEERMFPQLERLGYSNNTVIRKSDMIKVGSCGLYDREGLEGVDIGFAFLPQFEGKGYAFESSDMLKNLAIEKWNLKKIGAITLEDNKSSQRLLERLGLKFQKLMRLEGDSEELMYYLWEAKK
ncbi:GNAT family N-acetyltransferase [bacterium SCSIO 12643]|nr:GNAT family N-acetyltransferase [bacterium SCSIO 12643]